MYSDQACPSGTREIRALPKEVSKVSSSESSFALRMVAGYQPKQSEVEIGM